MLKKRLISILHWSEHYTKTDMVYFASGAFWSNFSSITVSILTLVASILFARFFTKNEYGNYQYILSIAGLIGATTLTGMNAAVTRAVARGYEGEFKYSIYYQIIAGIIPAFFGVCVSSWYFLHGNNTFALAFILIAIFLPLGNAYNTWGAYTGGKKLFRIGSYYGLFNNIITYLPILAAIYFGRSFLWVVFANYFFTFISSFIIYHHIIRYIPPNEKKDNDTIPYGIHLSFIGILGTFASQLDSLLVFHFIGSSSLAIYSFATIIPEKLAGMLKFIPNIAIPKLSARTELEVKNNIKNRFWILISLIIIAVIGYATIAPWIFHTFFPAYNSSILFTQVYALSFFSLVPAVLQAALTSQRKTKELYTLSFITPSIRIILMIILMFYYGIWGLLWAQIINNFVSMTLQLTLLFRKQRV